jgi:hypothetical protein
MGTKAPCIPRAFAISPLQREVLSWVMLVLQTPKSSLTPDKKMPIKSMTESGGGMGRDSDNPYLILDLSDGDQELLLRSFLSLCWQASWLRGAKRRLTGNQQQPVVTGTAGDSASYMPLAFWKRHRSSPSCTSRSATSSFQTSMPYSRSTTTPT